MGYCFIVVVIKTGPLGFGGAGASEPSEPSEVEFQLILEVCEESQP